MRPLTYDQAVASVTPALFMVPYVHARRGGVVPPLVPLYQGPYKVLKENSKFFSLVVVGRSEVVSGDHVKPHLALQM